MIRKEREDSRRDTQSSNVDPPVEIVPLGVRELNGQRGISSTRTHLSAHGFQPVCPISLTSAFKVQLRLLHGTQLDEVRALLSIVLDNLAENTHDV